jgi:hypothetical protein
MLAFKAKMLRPEAVYCTSSTGQIASSAISSKCPASFFSKYDVTTGTPVSYRTITEGNICTQKAINIRYN